MRPDGERLVDALDHVIHAITLLSRCGSDELAGNREAFQAFKFDLIVVGTTLGKISGGVRGLGRGVPWREVIDTRNRLVHAYWQVDATLLTFVTWERLNELAAALRATIDGVERAER